VKFLIGLVSGVVFGLGLVVSQMTEPARILGFLDVFGKWDPSLMFVMAGAIGVHAPFVFWLRRHGKPLLASRLSIPVEARVDAKLVIGSALFGLGWGLGGYCPGPAVVAATRNGSAAILALSMVVGMWLHDWLAERWSRNALRESKPPRLAHALPQGAHE
jgi:hypothetical protein